MKHAVLITWFLFTMWDGRVARFDFFKQATCEQARTEIIKAIGNPRVTVCMEER